MKARINLDANAGLSPSAPIITRTLKQLEGCLNPSSLHRPGQRARALIERAREIVRAFVGAERDDKIIFTSGATEANSLALYGALAHNPGGILSTKIEHHSVLEVLENLSVRGVKVELLSPTSRGICLDDFEAKLSSDFALISVMAANNETGLVLPLAAIARLARSRIKPVLVHSDAVQMFGRQACTIGSLEVDMLTLSGHKLGAFAGVGCLVARDHVSIDPQLRGGPQEGRLRAGTENLIGIASLAEAITELAANVSQRHDAMNKRREYLWSALSQRCKAAERMFAADVTLPNTLSLRFPNTLSADLLVALDLRAISVSAGSACASGRPEPSHVLLAHGLSMQEAREVIRISLCGDEAFEDLDYVAREIAACLDNTT